MFSKPIFKDLQSRFIAHRGANNAVPGNNLTEFPENTWPAFLEAYAKGASIVECDIYLTKDKEIIIIHDETLRRTARFNPKMASTLTLDEFNKIIDQDVGILNYADHLSQVDVGMYGNLDKKFCGTKIPLLKEFLTYLMTHSNYQLVIELKGENILLAEELSLLIKKYSLKPSQLMFISFNFDLIKISKKLLPDFKHLLLTTHNNELERKKTTDATKYWEINNFKDLQKIIEMITAEKLQGLHMQYHSAITKFIPEIHKHNLSCFVWNYVEDDTLEHAKCLLEANVDLINTNQPEYIFSKILMEAKVQLKI